MVRVQWLGTPTHAALLLALVTGGAAGEAEPAATAELDASLAVAVDLACGGRLAEARAHFEGLADTPGLRAQAAFALSTLDVLRGETGDRIVAAYRRAKGLLRPGAMPPLAALTVAKHTCDGASDVFW